jgi:hypothetical protein
MNQGSGFRPAAGISSLHFARIANQLNPVDAIHLGKTMTFQDPGAA